MKRSKKVATRTQKEDRRPSSHDGSNDDRQRTDQDVSTWLVIPYFNNDKGRPGAERPLSSSVVSWLCQAIIVNGQPGKNNFKRGAPTSVTVDVANWGAGTLSAPVYVRVWWSDPSTGFTTVHLFGQGVLAVPTGGGVRRTDPIVGTIPTSAPPHVCLLVNVWSPLEAGSATPLNPTNDRHWAQLNINELAAVPGQNFQFMFWVGNPLTRPATFEVTAQPLARDALPMLERVRRAEAVHLEQPRLQLREAGRRLGEASDEEAGSRCRLTLRAGERRPVHLVGELPADMTPGSSAVFEVVSTGLDDRDQAAFGSLGLVVTARSRD